MGSLVVEPIYRKHLGSGYAFPASVYLPVFLPDDLANCSNWLFCRVYFGDADPKPTLPSLVLGENREAHDAKLFRFSDLGDGSYGAIVHFNRQPAVELRVSATETATNEVLRIEFARIDSLVARAILVGRFLSELISSGDSPAREVAKDLKVFTKMAARETRKVTSQAKDIVLGVTPINLAEPPQSPMSDYEKWFFVHNGSSLEIKRRARKLSDSFPIRSKFSIVLPVYKSNEVFLREAVASVRRQIYTNWELIIVNDGSGDARLSDLLVELAKEEYRIRIVERPDNGGISEATNDGIGVATGDFVAFLDHDDILCEDALFWFADVVNRNNEVSVIYSDHDNYSESGHIKDHCFKPDWNPLLFLAQNYINHFVAVRRELALATPLRTEFNGSQDYDFLLRITAQVEDDLIVHIPRILYHWRILEGSVALDSSEKSYAIPAARKAVQRYLDEQFPGAMAEGEFIFNRVRFPIPSPAPSVAIVIPTRDGVELLKESIGTLVKVTTYPNYRIIVIDNQSSDPETLKYLSELESAGRIEIFSYDKPFSFSDMHNELIAKLDDELILMLNNDTSIIEGEWLTEMVSLISKFKIAAVGARLLYPDGTIQHGGVLVGLGGGAGHYGLNLDQRDPGYFGRLKLAHNVTAVTAACLLIRRDVYNEVNGMNTAQLGVAFNDVDLCLRINEAGYRVAWTPYASLVHHESKSRGDDGADRRKTNRLMGEISFLRARWETEIQDDPHYNPNLEIMTQRLFMTDKNPRIPTLGEFVEACYKVETDEQFPGVKRSDIENEELLRHKYQLRILESPFEYRRRNLD